MILKINEKIQFVYQDIGNLGKEIYLKLKQINTKTYIISRSKEQIIKDDVKEFYPLNYKNIIEIFNKSDIVINTIPSNIIPEEALNVDNKPYILDIASYPYGINEEFIEKYRDKINYKLYLGIPSKFAPKKASEILLKILKREMERG